jgi:LPS sulfotransferase NodH
LTVTVVTGLPRSGTSLAMAMLRAAGIPPLTDGVRAADEDNPRGYYELEAVKAGSDWLRDADGHAVKVISALLPRLPIDRPLRVVFMRRKLDEVLASQAAMMARRDEPLTASDAELRKAFVLHLAETEAWLDRSGLPVLYVSYNRLLREPSAQCQRLADFLDLPDATAAMAAVVEPSLYRNRG